MEFFSGRRSLRLCDTVSYVPAIFSAARVCFPVGFLDEVPDREAAVF